MSKPHNPRSHHSSHRLASNQTALKSSVPTSVSSGETWIFFATSRSHIPVRRAPAILHESQSPRRQCRRVSNFAMMPSTKASTRRASLGLVIGAPASWAHRRHLDLSRPEPSRERLPLPRGHQKFNCHTIILNVNRNHFNNQGLSLARLRAPFQAVAEGVKRLWRFSPRFADICGIAQRSGRPDPTSSTEHSMNTIQAVKKAQAGHGLAQSRSPPRASTKPRLISACPSTAHRHACRLLRYLPFCPCGATP